MANIDVTLEPKGGTFVPSVDSIPIAAGDSVTLHNSGGGPAFLFFSPDAHKLLSLKPGSVPSIAGGAKAEFTFGSSDQGAYSVYFSATDEDVPPGFPGNTGATLWLFPESWVLPVMQANPLTSGH